MHKPLVTFHCTFQKTAYFHVGLFLLLTLWVFVSHFGRLCWGRVSVRQPANMQLHRRRTGGEAVGVVGEHPIEERKKKKKSHYFSLCHLFPLSLNQKDQEKKQNGPQEEEKNQTDCTLHKHRNQFVYEKQRKKKNERSSVIWVIPSSCQHQGEWFGSLRRLVPDVPLQRRISFSACLFVARIPHSLMLNPLQYLIGNIWSEKHVCWHTWEQPSNQSWVDSSWLTCFPLVNVFKVKRGSSFWLEAFRGFSLYVFCASRITGLKYKSPTSSVTTQSRSTILERSQKFTRLIFHVWKL